MKLALVLLLVAVSQASVLRNFDTRTIPAPILTRLVSLHPPGFKVEWRPVKSSDPADPVLGYKVKIWEQEKQEMYTYKNVDGVLTLVEDVMLKEFPKDEIPFWEPTVLDVSGPESSELFFDNIKIGLFYEIRVQAYTAKEEGPLSKPMRLKFEED